jgi:glycosyltransferase involved in cell wall biosynthesis
MELTILMPCLNEANTLEVCILKAQRFLAESGIVGEVVIADNGSTDGSQEIVRSCGARLIEVPVRGYGAALAEGSRRARGRFVIMGDSDDSYDFLDLMPFVESLRAGNDLVMGNRFIGGIKTGAMPWKNRWIGNPGVTAIGRLFFGAEVGDFYCGLRGYSRKAFDRMNLKTSGMEFALEMVMKATFFKMRVTEVPATLKPDGRGRPPHLRPWRDGWRSLRFMLLYSPRWLFLYPGVALMVVGAAFFLRLLFGPFRIGRINLDVDTLHYASVTILIGFQAALFWVYAKVFAVTGGLLPAENAWATRWGRRFTLEGGLLAGGALVALGAVGGGIALAYWGRHAFGNMNTATLLRLVDPSALALILGVQIILSSFFLSLLQLQKR